MFVVSICILTGGQFVVIGKIPFNVICVKCKEKITIVITNNLLTLMLIFRDVLNLAFQEDDLNN